MPRVPVPPLVPEWIIVAGLRDPLVHVDRIHVLTPLLHVDAVAVPGAHALNFSQPAVAALVEAHIEGSSLHRDEGVLSVVELLAIPG